MSLTAHVSNLRQSISYHIKNLWRIRRFIDRDTCHNAVRAMIISRLDYCNGVFTLLSAKNIQRLQRLQNSAARLVFVVDRRVEFDQLLRSLHWLPIQQRAMFKSLVYVYKALNNMAPSYISELLTPYVPARPLRSAMDTTRLLLPKSNSVSGDRRFAVTATKAWNSLPIIIRTAPSINIFKKHLKTYLFQ